MSRLFYHVMQDHVGNLLFDVSGTMRLAGSGTLATIYGDEALTVILPNPMTNHPSFGSFKCYLGAGDFDFYMAKSGYTFETLTGVQGHGTMAQQNANAVAISGGSATLTALSVVGSAESAQIVTHGIRADDFTSGSGVALGFFGNLSAGTNRYNLYMDGTAPNYIRASLGVGAVPFPANKLNVFFTKATDGGVAIIHQGGDTGTGNPVLFYNAAVVSIGSISSTASGVAYNTTSDPRLKEAVEPLPDALATVQALRPVRFRWRADGAGGEGFLATEVQAVVPLAVTGTPDAVDASGAIVPMGLDASKLVPHLVGAIQALVARVEALEARLA